MAKWQAKKQVEVKRLYRSDKDKWLGGGCGGIGEYFEVDSTLVRLLWIALTLVSFGFGIIAYIIAWIIIPKNPHMRRNPASAGARASKHGS